MVEKSDAVSISALPVPSKESVSAILVSFVSRFILAVLSIISPPFQNGHGWNWHGPSVPHFLQNTQYPDGSFPAPVWNNEMMLVFFKKSSTFNGEKNRAVPFVGSTWFGPAK